MSIVIFLLFSYRNFFRFNIFKTKLVIDGQTDAPPYNQPYKVNIVIWRSFLRILPISYQQWKIIGNTLKIFIHLSYLFPDNSLRDKLLIGFCY